VPLPEDLLTPFCNGDLEETKSSLGAKVVLGLWNPAASDDEDKGGDDDDDDLIDDDDVTDDELEFALLEVDFGDEMLGQVIEVVIVVVVELVGDPAEETAESIDETGDETGGSNLDKIGFCSANPPGLGEDPGDFSTSFSSGSKCSSTSLDTSSLTS
jgi:hypothetical protein